MKSILNHIGVAAMVILFAATACNNATTTTTEETVSMETTPDTQVIPLTIPAVDTPKITKMDTVLIKTSMGDITVVLYNETPKHHDNFLKLVNEKFYNGILFHRVMKGFMIQGGDPNSKDSDPRNDGQGGPGYTIPAEINGNLLHKKGALAAARTENPEKASSGSQFYICHVATPMLDGNYTVFGETIAGFDVIDKIASVQVSPQMPDGSGNRPLKDVKIISTSIVKNGKPVKEGKADSKSKKGE